MQGGGGGGMGNLFDTFLIGFQVSKTVLESELTEEAVCWFCSQGCSYRDQDQTRPGLHIPKKNDNETEKKK